LIITDLFVYVHQPKTGGTFVTYVLNELFKKFSNNLTCTDSKKLIDIAKHDTCSEIPNSHNEKPILATVRNPYDRYVSQFEFKWWKDYPEQFGSLDRIKRALPHFPEISFEEFVRLANAEFLNLENNNFGEHGSLGWHTEQFIRFFCKNPALIFGSITEESLTEQSIIKHLYGIHFIFTNNLNQGLYDYLFGLGLEKDKINFILDLKKIYPKAGGRNKKQKWKKYYSPELKQFVRYRERLLFSIFPEFDQ